MEGNYGRKEIPYEKGKLESIKLVGIFKLLNM